ncbi:hypothetical protein HKCCE3408_07070 [Rhodobacterales bacterium HKCCE3408]|nr:hypothetical protein [Rhodobacterales bacterium HKCCE3408]
MGRTIPAFVINLARRPDRLGRMAEHLAGRGVAFTPIGACDAADVTDTTLDAVISASGPLGALGNGDRACTVSHTMAWAAFLKTDAAYALILEDDVYLSEDIAACLADDDWVPHGLLKLEKFNDGASRILLGREIGQTPTGRAIRPLLSRHAGGGAYILSRASAEAGLAHRGRFSVPVDHALFNQNVSLLARRLKPAMVVPAMATQRQWAYNSDIAKLGKAARPTGMALRWRKLKRGLYEANRLPQQAMALASGRGRIEDVSFAEAPPAS